MRLGPLLAVCIAAWVIIAWLAGTPLPVSDILGGFVFPTWPRGTWTISIELQFYLLFPLLLLLFRRHGPFALLAVVAGAMLLRFDWWRTYGEAQHIAYWTIVGRIDQFVFGMLFALVSIRRNVLNIVAATAFASFLVLWTELDRMGGYTHFGDAASPSPLWIVLPTVEAITWGSLIAWYDGASFKMPALARPRARQGRRVVLLDLSPALFPGGAAAQRLLGPRQHRQLLPRAHRRQSRLPGVPAGGGAVLQLF